MNSFLDKMNPTEEQMASYIDTMRERQWPEFPPTPPPPPRTEEDKNETREKAHNLISARCRTPFLQFKEIFGYFLAAGCITVMYFFFFPVDSNYLVLKKTDMESVFNLFQEREENKTLVYVSILIVDLCHHSLFIASDFHSLFYRCFCHSS